MKTLVIAETPKAARELAAGARFDGDVILFAFDESQAICGIADKVVKTAVPEDAWADDVADTLVAVIKAEGANRVFAEPTRRVKNIIGQAAAKTEAAVITDVAQLDGDAATNLYFGGIAEKTQKALSPIAFYTVGSGLFSEGDAVGSDVIEEVAWVSPAKPVSVMGVEQLPAASVNLQDADVVVAAGRGFAEKEELDMARALCDKIGGELGCTRPIAEAEQWMPRETYIGVSGVMLKPDVYVGLGLSGQMQHMVGVNRARVIFAVNKDKNAPIFKQCDYGLVGDLKTVLPMLVEQL